MSLGAILRLTEASTVGCSAGIGLQKLQLTIGLLEWIIFGVQERARQPRLQPTVSWAHNLHSGKCCTIQMLVLSFNCKVDWNHSVWRGKLLPSPRHSPNPDWSLWDHYFIFLKGGNGTAKMHVTSRRVWPSGTFLSP